jgi:hypothetical protein
MSAHPHDCDKAAILEEIRKDVRSILVALAGGAKEFEQHERRITWLERLTWGVAGLIGVEVLGVVGAVLVWSLRSMPGAVS